MSFFTTLLRETPPSRQDVRAGAGGNPAENKGCRGLGDLVAVGRVIVALDMAQVEG
jgi:hypothetical protein